MDKLVITNEDSIYNTSLTFSKEFETMFVEDFFEAVLRAYDAMGYQNTIEINIHNPVLGVKKLTFDNHNGICEGDFNS